MIPQCSPELNYLALKAEIDTAVQRVLDSGWYVMGPECGSFEEEYARFNGSGHAISVGNGTDAVEIALRALKVGPGDKVITVSHTAVATVSAIARTGATPVFADIANDYTLSVEALASLLESGDRYQAIVVVHLYGLPADMASIIELAEGFDVPVIEDCAQAHGAMIGTQKVGTFGRLGCFSFYPTKNLGALGDGGLIVCEDEALAQACRRIKQYGWDEQRNSTEPGVNSRLDEVQAAILRVKLEHLDRFTESRRRIAQIYDGHLPAGIARPCDIGDRHHVYHQYVISTAEREALRAFLSESQIATAIHYPVPAHRQSPYTSSRNAPAPLTRTEQSQGVILSLPMYPELPDTDAERVCEVISEFTGR